MDADSSVSADLVLVDLSASRSRPPPARPRPSRHWPGRRRSGRFVQLRKELCDLPAICLKGGDTLADSHPSQRLEMDLPNRPGFHTPA